MGVASYFSFMRWILTQHVAMFPFLIFHSVAHFVTSVRHYSPGVLLNVFEFSGSLVSFSSYNPGEDKSYAYTLMGVVSVLIATTLAKWIAEDRFARELNAIELAQSGQKFSKVVLGTWDFGVQTIEDVENLRQSTGQAVVLLFDSEAVEQLAQSRDCQATSILYLRRFLGILTFIALQTISAVTIVGLNAYSSQVEGTIAAIGSSGGVSAGTVATISASVVPASVTVINTIMPVIITKITEAEQWDDPKTHVKAMMSRMFLAKILNAIVQIVGVFLLADPFLLAQGERQLQLRKDLGVAFDPTTYACRADQAANVILQAVLVEFTLSKVVDIVSPLAARVKARVTGKAWKKSEFDLPKKMVSMLYFHSLAFALTPFCTLAPILIALLVMLNFRFGRFELLTFLKKPKRPFKAQDAGNFFVKFYIVTFVLLGLGPIHFLFQGRTFPKTCSRMLRSIGNVSNPVADYHPYFRTNPRTFLPPECSGEFSGTFPDCMCSGSLQCGPFTRKSKPYKVISENAQLLPIFGGVYSFLRKYVSLAWCAVFFLVIIVFFISNQEKVLRRVANDAEIEWRLKYGQVQDELQRSKNKIEKLNFALKQQTDAGTKKKD